MIHLLSQVRNDLSTSRSGDTITIQHDNSGASAGSYGSQFVVPSITVDTRRSYNFYI